MSSNAFDRVVVSIREAAAAAGVHVLDLNMGPLLECVDRWMGREDVTDWGETRGDVAEAARLEAVRRMQAEQDLRSAAMGVRARARFYQQVAK